MKAYSEDLRTKIVAAVGRGMPKIRAAHIFDVSLSSVKRYVSSARRGESLSPRKSSGRPSKIDGSTLKLLEADLQDRPQATIADRRGYLQEVTGNLFSEVTLRRLLKRLGYSRKKGRWVLLSETSSGELPGRSWSPSG